VSWQREVELPGRGAVLLLRGSVLPAAGGGGYVVVFDDITQLIDAQRATAWAEVARRVAHEIKNPLTPIQLAAERLEAKLGPRLGPEDARALSQATATIVTQVAALKNMVDEFREYARLPTPRLEALDLNALVQDVLSLYEESGTRLEARLEPGLAPVIGDRNQLRQVIHNLLQNAQDALSGTREPRIEVVTERNGGGGAILRISDNGSGFPETIAKRAFEPYVTTKPRGTGLGLAIVKKIIDEHHGSIVIESGASHGAAVCISLPFGKAA
jgi:nitrogen fixation/metabolism regulation signal transduction histidine kinase